MWNGWLKWINWRSFKWKVLWKGTSDGRGISGATPAGNECLASPSGFRLFVVIPFSQILHIWLMNVRASGAMETLEFKIKCYREEGPKTEPINQPTVSALWNPLLLLLLHHLSRSNHSIRSSSTSPWTSAFWWWPSVGPIGMDRLASGLLGLKMKRA